CPRPPNIANGLHSGQSLDKFPLGVTMYYGCKDGYQLVGNVSINCTENGLWSRPLPRCEELMCPRPPNIANGLHSGQSLDKFSQGVTVYYGCKDGYQLVGNVSINCTEKGLWSRPLPRCEGG
ncbi:CR1 protein, partial [Corythaeola cristata]|nr:CR1 protein [Corythaeola cristata]